MPLSVLVPAMGLQIGTLSRGIGLDLSPIAVECILPSPDALLRPRDRAVVHDVGGHARLTADSARRCRRCGFSPHPDRRPPRAGHGAGEAGPSTGPATPSASP